MLKLNNRLSATAIIILALLAGCNRQKAADDQPKGKPEAPVSHSAAAPDTMAPKQESSQPTFAHDIEGYKASDLGEAIYQDSLTKFKVLVEKGASVEKCLTDETYIYDALYAALVFGRVDLIKYIVQNNQYSDINKTYSEDAETPLTLACNMQDKDEALQIAQLLIENKAKVDGSGPSGGEETKYPLLIAVKRNNIALTQALIEKGARKDVAENSGATAGSIAADSGFSEIAELVK